MVVTMEEDIVAIIFLIIISFIVGSIVGLIVGYSICYNSTTDDLCKIVCPATKEYLVCKDSSYDKVLAKIQRLKDYGR